MGERVGVRRLWCGWGPAEHGRARGTRVEVGSEAAAPRGRAGAPRSPAGVWAGFGARRRADGARKGASRGAPGGAGALRPAAGPALRGRRRPALCAGGARAARPGRPEAPRGARGRRAPLPRFATPCRPGAPPAAGRSHTRKQRAFHVMVPAQRQGAGGGPGQAPRGPTPACMWGAYLGVVVIGARRWRRPCRVRRGARCRRIVWGLGFAGVERGLAPQGAARRRRGAAQGRAAPRCARSRECGARRRGGRAPPSPAGRGIMV
ncbi:MAG: hypothetical protein J3K34DRAFT_117403 [Monoraphidium minutum]|nr:MAG: hypothetical protein J3K34DRAFT_117403 [Monoraphidium minutum]